MGEYIKAIIIDDEPHALRALRVSVEKYCPGVRIIAEAQNITDGYECIIKSDPDLVFLDINMPNGSGFDLLNQIKHIEELKVIFTTAHDKYAIKALRFSAIDYLLKPIDKDELISAIQRFKRLQATSYSLHVNLLQNLVKDKKPPEKVAINTADSIHIVTLKDIFFLASEKNYTHIHFKDSSIVASKSLRIFEDLLSESQFLRVHRSFIINISHAVEYQKKQFKVLLSNGVTIDVARNRKDVLSEKLQDVGPSFNQ